LDRAADVLGSGRPNHCHWQESHVGKKRSSLAHGRMAVVGHPAPQAADMARRRRRGPRTSYRLVCPLPGSSVTGRSRNHIMAIPDSWRRNLTPRPPSLKGKGERIQEKPPSHHPFLLRAEGRRVIDRSAANATHLLSPKRQRRPSLALRAQGDERLSHWLRGNR
jgi:hypothetical protein